MKHLLSFLVTVLFSTALFAQDEALQYFKVEGNGITWQKTYPTVLSIDDMKSKFANLQAFDSQQESGMKITGSAKPIENNYIEQGYSEKSAKKYVVQKDCAGQLTVDFSEGKYRVTLKDIKLMQRYTTKKSPRGEMTRLTDVAYDAKKMRWEPDFISSGSAKIINQTLLKRFDIQGKFGGADF